MIGDEPAVYVLKSNARYKIGVAADVDKRIRQLQTGNAAPIYQFCLLYPDDAYKTEKWLHNRYKAVRVAGEWFKLSRRQVLELQLVESNECIDDWMRYIDRHGDLSYEDFKDIAPFMFEMLACMDASADDTSDERIEASWQSEHDDWRGRERQRFPQNFNPDGSEKPYRRYVKPCPACSVNQCYIQPTCSLYDERILCGACGYIWTEATLSYELLMFGRPLQKGMKVKHPFFGIGRIIKNTFTKTEYGKEVDVNFTNAGRRSLVVTLAKLQILD